MQTSLVTPYIFAALIVIVGANSGVNELLGAHPFWAVSVAWVGVPAGLLLAIAAKLLGLRWVYRILLFFICLVAAYAIASFGKARFTDSFAADSGAGRLWYFGWIAASGFATAFIAAAFSPTRTHSGA